MSLGENAFNPVYPADVSTDSSGRLFSLGDIMNSSKEDVLVSTKFRDVAKEKGKSKCSFSLQQTYLKS